MKTVLDAATRQELADRFKQLTADTQPVWGTMTAPQMVKHCRLWEEMIRDNKRYKRPLIGRLIGPLILKQVLKSPEFRRNSPTIPEFRVTDTDIDMEKERKQLLVLLDGYAGYQAPDNSFTHPFFGPMTREQIGQFSALHLNHHLKQFGK